MAAQESVKMVGGQNKKRAETLHPSLWRHGWRTRDLQLLSPRRGAASVEISALHWNKERLRRRWRFLRIWIIVDTNKYSCLSHLLSRGLVRPGRPKGKETLFEKERRGEQLAKGRREVTRLKQHVRHDQEFALRKHGGDGVQAAQQ